VIADDLPRRIDQLTALEYRRPGQLAADGEVLVVGASASGVQIAEELRAAGRAVTIAVGEHIRLPRAYRGRDIYEWLDRIGQLDERYDEVEDVERARRHASVQLVGADPRRDLDLDTLHERGVRVVGRLMAVDGTRALCSGGLANLVKNADLKQERLLRRIDEYVDELGLREDVGPATRPRATAVGDAPTELDLTPFTTIVWATGYRPRYAWLPPEAFDRRGRVAHDGGVGALPGLYLLGLPFLRRRRSNLVSGVGLDADELGAHLRVYVDERARRRVTLMSS
jgi:putative flavoprotein involved in K+ transport